MHQTRATMEKATVLVFIFVSVLARDAVGAVPISCAEIREILAVPGPSPLDAESPRRLDGRAVDDLACFADPAGALTFATPADFRGVVFGAGVSFGNARFEKEVSFKEAKFDAAPDSLHGRQIEFAGAVFEREADFTGAAFRANASFNRCKFGGDVRFSRGRFSKDLWLGQSRFDGNLLLDHVEVGEFVELSRSMIVGDVDIDGAQIHGALELEDAKLLGSLSILRAAVGILWMQSVRIAGRLDGSYSIFGGAEAIMEPGQATSLLERVVVEGQVDFSDARFAGPAIVSRSEFKEGVNLRGAAFDGPIEWSRVESGRFRIDDVVDAFAKHLVPRIEHTGRLKALDEKEAAGVEDVKAVIERLREGFREAWQLQQFNELTAMMHENDGDISYLSRILFGMPSRWGTDLCRVLVVTLGAYLVFALLFFGGLWRGYLTSVRVVPEGEWRDQVHFRLRLTESVLVGEPRFLRWLRGTKLSLSAAIAARAFFKVGFGYRYRVYPEGWGYVLVALAWVGGLFMLVHVAVTLLSTMPVVGLLFYGAN